MPNCYFLAAGNDYRTIFEFIFEQPNCRVYPATSKNDQQLAHFRDLEDLVAYYEIADWSTARSGFHCKIHALDAGGNVVARRIEFKKNSVKNGAFRYDTEGWGLIHVHLGDWSNGF